VIEPNSGTNWAQTKRDLDKGRIGRGWARFLNAGQRKWKGKMDIMVAQTDFECTHGILPCTHVRASCHVWEI
jgi:hypothetical protein